MTPEQELWQRVYAAVMSACTSEASHDAAWISRRYRAEKEANRAVEAYRKVWAT